MAKKRGFHIQSRWGVDRNREKASSGEKVLGAGSGKYQYRVPRQPVKIFEKTTKGEKKYGGQWSRRPSKNGEYFVHENYVILLQRGNGRKDGG